MKISQDVEAIIHENISSSKAPKFNHTAASIGADEDLQVVCLGTDGLPYLFWQGGVKKSQWHYEGKLLHDKIEGIKFTSVAASIGADKDLQAVCLGTDGLPYLFWQGGVKKSQWHYEGKLLHDKIKV
ncbi:hypothetical protein DU72_08390 [Methanosarcina mazei]|uniref:Uncharacterized protein n=2 Tax=Methanosarcina mazei TaxID=2209 RepID=A0A0F8N3X3_METMZ|nr:hypothetical protein DU72_08390 [Methanosarcina mazei]